MKNKEYFLKLFFLTFSLKFKDVSRYSPSTLTHEINEITSYSNAKYINDSIYELESISFKNLLYKKEDIIRYFNLSKDHLAIPLYCSFLIKNTKSFTKNQ